MGFLDNEAARQVFHFGVVCRAANNSKRKVSEVVLVAYCQSFLDDDPVAVVSLSHCSMASINALTTR